MVVVLLALAALPFGALAWADHDAKGRVPEGVLVAGVDVGGLDATTAISRLRAQVGTPLDRPVRVTVDDKTFKLSARKARLSLDIEAAVDRAVDRGRSGSFLARGWRELTGKKLRAAESITVSVDRAAVRRFVDKIAAEVEVAPQEAALDISLESVSVGDSTDGRRLPGADALTDRIVKSLKSVSSSRHLHAKTVTVEPSLSSDSIWASHPSIVTVSHDEKLARLFENGELVKSYHVAVGSPEYPTPYGTFTVQSMQVDPPWNVPNSEWAGDLAGKTIPGGDPGNPLVARWIGFDGSVGFHGTADIASLGSAASHGCVRMDPKDVIDLYEHVDVGTTVYVA